MLSNLRQCFLLAILILTASTLSAQSFIFLEPDPIPNCALIKNGTFRSTEYSHEEYYMTVADGFITEYVQDGKYFVRSQQIFIAPCRYKTVIAEVTIPNYNLKPGDFSITEIVETECQYIKVTTEMGKNKITTVYEKED